MTKIVAAINGVNGTVKITIKDGKSIRDMDFRWCIFDEDDSTGFMTSFIKQPVKVTYVAAEHFIRMVLSGLVRGFHIEKEDLTIINHLGERISDVQFLPPTFQGNEADIMTLVAQQESLLKLYALYEECGALDEQLMELAAEEGIVDDFLSLVHMRASGIFLTGNPIQSGD